MHKGCHAGLDRSIVMVVQLLSLGRLSTKEGASAQPQVKTLTVILLVDKEVLLLGAHLCRYMLRLRVAEEPQDTHTLTIQSADRTQQRRFLIQRLTGVGAEDGGDIEGLVLDEGVRGGIPRGVASCLKGGAQAAGGEGGGVSLTAAQFLAGELHQNVALTIGDNKAIVLFGSKSRHGLEPVGIMGSTQLNGPVLHGDGDFIGNVTIQRRTLCKALLPGMIRFGAQTLAHLFLGKYHAAKQFGYIVHSLIHCDSPFAVIPTG